VRFPKESGRRLRRITGIVVEKVERADWHTCKMI
jgi:hypothetical protein